MIQNDRKEHHKGYVLIVDDEKDIRTSMRIILEYEGYVCWTVATSDEAIDSIRREKFDLVITDLNLPGSAYSGIEMIEQVIDYDNTLPVILMTGFPSIHCAVDAMKRGAVEFLTKPLDRDRLLHLAAKALQERRLRKENCKLQAEVNKTQVIEKLNRELNSRINEVTRLYTISEGLNQFMDSIKVFDRIIDLAVQATGARRISVMLFDRTRKHLRIRSSLGLPDHVVKQTKILPGEGVAGQVAQTGKSIRITKNVIKHENQSVEGTNYPTYTTHSWLSLPLLIGQEVFGVINLTDKNDCTDFTIEDEHIMQTLSEKAGTKLENMALYEGIYANLIDTLTSLVTTIEAKDPYTREHSQRVTEYSMLLGQFLNLPDEEIEMLDFAGMLHDIGKIGVRDGILSKPGRLTVDEYHMVKQHPIVGERIVQPLGLVKSELAIIRHHHERYDGSGYPDGLAGEEIPILARIVAVTDAFDAMTTTRSYRKSLSVDRAVSEMTRCAGTQFDPRVVNVMMIALNEGTIQAPEDLPTPACPVT